MSSKDKKSEQLNEAEQNGSKDMLSFDPLDKAKAIERIRKAGPEEPKVDKIKNPTDNDLNLDNQDDVDYDYENKKELEEVKKENSELKQGTKPIHHDAENVIELIQQAHDENKNIPVEIVNVLPLLKRDDFLDLIVDEGIPFTSQENSALAEDYCRMLLYMSDKIKEIKDNSHDVSKVMASSANKFASKLGETFDMLDEQKVSSYYAKAKYFNDKGIKSPRGKTWSRETIKNTYLRWQKIKSEEEKNNQNLSSSKSPKP